MKKFNKTQLCILAGLLTFQSVAVLAATNEEKAEIEKHREEQKQLQVEARALRHQAEQSVEKAVSLRAEKQVEKVEEMERMREELSRTHRELRKVSREVAREHRRLESNMDHTASFRVINVGDRAVLGVILGEESEDGLSLLGISPDGPAERAGLKQGDILVSIAGENLSSSTDQSSRELLYGVMDEVNPGEELLVEVLRDDETWEFTVIPDLREPRSWQSVIRLPGLAPDAPNAPTVIMETMVMPDFDEAEFEKRIEAIQKQAEGFEFVLKKQVGHIASATGNWQIDIENFSELGEHAMREANVWFDLPMGFGLELATLNPELGKYFKAEQGVLVIEAREDNIYGLQSGDVIQSIAKEAVGSPSDFMRKLRDLEPGTEIELAIKRDGKDELLLATVSESHLGLVHGYESAKPPVAPLAPTAAARNH